ncbi:MAG TPA: hypothetical protein VE821_02060, partial [Pyrinomonadaceae bacterium]|nr:hypothetical protein [Pyrinomonadaceae bacterium]
SLRVRRNSGVFLEDIGVAPDYIHQLTRNDLLQNNVDLLAYAGKILSQLPVRVLNTEVSAGGAGKLRLAVSTAGFSRLDIYLNDHPYTSLNLTTSTATLELAAKDSSIIKLQGFDKDQLVAARRIALSSSPAPKRTARA